MTSPVQSLAIIASALVVPLLTQGCLEQLTSHLPQPAAQQTTAPPPTSPLSPDRSLFARLAPQDLESHAKAVLEALETAEQARPHRWQGSEPDVGGSITVARTHGLENDGQLVCRYVYDRLTFRGREETVDDTACWAKGDWYWLRKEPNWPVAKGLPLPFDYYVIKSGGTLSDVARVSGTALDELKRLNPHLSGRLGKGSKVRLP